MRICMRPPLQIYLQLPMQTCAQWPLQPCTATPVATACRKGYKPYQRCQLIVILLFSCQNSGHHYSRHPYSRHPYSRHPYSRHSHVVGEFCFIHPHIFLRRSLNATNTWVWNHGTTLQSRAVIVLVHQYTSKISLMTFTFAINRQINILALPYSNRIKTHILILRKPVCALLLLLFLWPKMIADEFYIISFGCYILPKARSGCYGLDTIGVVDDFRQSQKETTFSWGVLAKVNRDETIETRWSVAIHSDGKA